MAHLIFGSTKCPICNQVLQAGDEITSFPAFVANRNSPLRIFSDAVLHKDCFHQHPLSQEAEIEFARVQEEVSRNKPE